MIAAARPVLVIAATDLELAPLVDVLATTPTASAWGSAVLADVEGTPVVLQALGIGKANTGAGLVAGLHAFAPRAVIQVGVGGAYLGSFLSVGMVAVAREELDLSLGVASAAGWRGLEAIGFPLTPARADRPARGNLVPTHAGLRAAIAKVAHVAPLRFATVETLGDDVGAGAVTARTHEVAIESMEGVAAAQVCDRLDVPFLEIRGVSNIVGDRDRTRWNLRAAAHASCDVVRSLLRRWDEAVPAEVATAEVATAEVASAAVATAAMPTDDARG